jgi:MoaA/NifB/PqqE/SkfB family radical SAM enzyme
MEKMSVVTRSNQHQDSIVFFENEQIMREDCLRAPASISFHITQFCPKQCKHCVTESSPYVDRTGEVSPEGWFKIIEKLRDFGCTSIVFTGGDCLAKERIFDILKKADDEKFLVAVLTDYDGLNLKHIKELKSLKHLVDLQVSLDGSNAGTHDWMRGPGAFEQALKRMKKLNDNGLKYTVSAAIHKGNLEEVEAIADICNQYGANNLYLAPLCTYGRGKNLAEYILSENELKILGQKYLKLVADDIVDPGNPFWIENVHRLGDNTFHPFEYSLDAVSTGFFNLSIDWKGRCFLDTKLRSENILYFGNALTDEIKDIWFSPKLNNVRKLSNPEAVYVHQNDLMRYIS